MSYISKETGGVRITFDTALLTESRMWCETSFPGYASQPTADYLPRIYWESEVQAKTELGRSGYIFLQPGTKSIRFYMELSMQRQFDFSEVRSQPRPIDNLKFKILLRSDATDPQLGKFGERTYTYNYKKGMTATANRFQANPETGHNPGPWAWMGTSGTQRRLEGAVYMRYPLVKQRRIFLQDISGARPPTYATSIAALEARYPPGPNTEAPYPIATTDNPEFDILVRYSFNLHTEKITATGNKTDGWLLPIGARILYLNQLASRATLLSNLTNAQNRGYTGAVRLFDVVRIVSIDDGPWAPNFLGQDLNFEEKPFDLRIDYNEDI